MKCRYDVIQNFDSYTDINIYRGEGADPKIT